MGGGFGVFDLFFNHQATLHRPIQDEGHIPMPGHVGLRREGVEAFHFFGGKADGDWFSNNGLGWHVGVLSM